jgi:glycosyltransferase involved in cell wall biosynthesis
MDDWMTFLYRRYPWDRVTRSRMLRGLHSIIEAAPVRLSIGEAMSYELGRRYGVPFLPFMNCIDTDIPCAPVRRAPRQAGLRFVFTGGLHHGRDAQLREVGQALASPEPASAMGELVVFGPPPSAETTRMLESIPSIRLGGLLRSSEVMPELVESDCLVLVESFDAELLRYTRFSMSTKLPEYLAAGRPIFVYGPGEQASARYIKENGCGVVVERRDRRLIREALRTLTCDAELRVRLGARARQVAVERHDGPVVRAEFRAALAAACASGRERQA